ncbi:DUF1850 domain-containing protein [Rossellomorea marisflavi]|uniref:DUF1850 domain-containing protein n=1 Tax=Rossellomorea marisflavi TaxID=189381 RepID=UPI003AD861D7
MKRFILAGFVILVGIAIFVPFQERLTIVCLSTEAKTMYVKLPENREFSIEYTHSIHLSEVQEYYKILGKGAEITQYALLYEDTSIGMPSDAEGDEVFSRTKDGKYLISNMDRKFPYIDLQIGQVVANHRIKIGKSEYELSEFFGKGEFVRFQWKRASLFAQWKGVTVNGKR